MAASEEEADGERREGGGGRRRRNGEVTEREPRERREISPHAACHHLRALFFPHHRSSHCAHHCPDPRWMAMSDDDPPPRLPNDRDGARVQNAAARSLFVIPPSLKRVFDRFPLVCYADNELPLRAPSTKSSEPALYVFTTAEHARTGRPSFNPACLRWQVRGTRPPTAGMTTATTTTTTLTLCRWAVTDISPPRRHSPSHRPFNQPCEPDGSSAVSATRRRQ